MIKPLTPHRRIPYTLARVLALHERINKESPKAMANNRPADIILRCLLLSGTAWLPRCSRLITESKVQPTSVDKRETIFWSDFVWKLLDFPVAQFNKLVMFKYDDLHPKSKSPTAKEIIS